MSSIIITIEVKHNDINVFSLIKEYGELNSNLQYKIINISSQLLLFCNILTNTSELTIKIGDILLKDYDSVRSDDFIKDTIQAILDDDFNFLNSLILNDEKNRTSFIEKIKEQVINCLTKVLNLNARVQ